MVYFVAGNLTWADMVDFGWILIRKFGPKPLVAS